METEWGIVEKTMPHFFVKFDKKRIFATYKYRYGLFFVTVMPSQRLLWGMS